MRSNAAISCTSPGDVSRARGQEPLWYLYRSVTAEPSVEPRSRILFGIRVVVGVLAVGFVIWTVADLIRSVDLATLSVSWPWVALSLLPLVAGVYVLAYGFALLIARLSPNQVSIRAIMCVQIESQLARYAPGKVGVPLVRLAAAEQLGVTRRAMVSAMGIEALSWVAVGGAMGLSMLMLTRRHAPAPVSAQLDWLLPLVAAFALGTLALMVLDRRVFPAVFLRLLKVEGTGPLVPPMLVAAHVAYWATWGLHGLCMSRAVGAEFGVAAASSGLYMLAPIVGFLALVAPAGAGVREALLTAGLAPAVGATAAIAAAVLSRIASVVSDFGSWLLSR